MHARSKQVRTAVLAAAVLIAIGGCNSPRALPSVREQGDRAFNRGDYEKARAEYNEYLSRKPGEAAVELQLAKTMLELNQPSEALGHAQVAYDLKPGDEEYIETYARALLAAQRTDQLYRFLRGRAQDGGGVGDYLRLGRFTAQMGDADGAEHAFTTAASVDRGQTLAPQLALADFYRSIGDLESEKRRLRMALYIEPTNSGVMERLRALGEIPGPSLALKPAEAP